MPNIPSENTVTRVKSLFFGLAAFVIVNLMVDAPPSAQPLRDPKILPAKPIRHDFEKLLADGRPEIVLLGNSMLGRGVDVQLFNELAGIPTMALSQGGAASAWWYLTIKNVILRAPVLPKMVVLLFRDDFLTRPTYRTTGRYLARINEMRSGEGEPLLDELAYPKTSVPWQHRILRQIPLYRGRARLKPAFTESTKGWLVPLLDGDRSDRVDMNQAIARVFAPANLDLKLMTSRQENAEKIADKAAHSFAESLGVSLLPEIIRLTRENHVSLVLVRMKRRRDVVQGQQPEELLTYMWHLREYCSDNGIPLIDFTDSAQLTLDHYADGDHLEPQVGVPIFTAMLAESIALLATKYDLAK